MFTSLDISTTGMLAQRTRMDVTAGNIAMADVTEDESGRPNPYHRRFTVFQSGSSLGKDVGVHVAGVEEDQSFRLEYEPGHKDAIKEGPSAGYVKYPNIDLAFEYLNGMEAARAYEANIAAFQLSKSMITNAIRLLA